jgi:CRP-like cAMP-binding protein
MDVPSAARARLIRASEFLCKLPDAPVSELAGRMTRKVLPAGSTIFSRGDRGNALFAVASGSVKISIWSSEGRELTINTVRPGEVFGEIALLDGGIRTADATAVTECVLMVLERRDLLSLLNRTPELAICCIELLCQRLRRTTEQLEDGAFLSLSTRLAKILLSLSRDGASQQHAAISITQREISKMIGASRESTNKQLRGWAKKGFIRLERGGIVVLDRQKLMNAAEQQP